MPCKQSCWNKRQQVEEVLKQIKKEEVYEAEGEKKQVKTDTEHPPWKPQLKRTQSVKPKPTTKEQLANKTILKS